MNFKENRKQTNITKGKWISDDQRSNFSNYSIKVWHYTYQSLKKKYTKEQLNQRKISGIKNGYHIDHWDGNGLNCMKSNLRKCTYSQNQANQRIKVGGTSEYKGVCIEHSAYISSIKYKNKTIRLGRSLCQKHCEYLYNVKSIEIHGEFANPNVIKYNFQITL